MRILLFLLFLLILVVFIVNIKIDYFHGGGVSYPFGNMAAYVRQSYPCGYRGYPYDTIYPTSTPYPSSSSSSISSFV